MAPTIVLAPGRLADASSQVGTGLTVNSQIDWSYRVRPSQKSIDRTRATKEIPEKPFFLRLKQ